MDGDDRGLTFAGTDETWFAEFMLAYAKMKKKLDWEGRAPERADSRNRALRYALAERLERRSVETSKRELEQESKLKARCDKWQFTAQMNLIPLVERLEELVRETEITQHEYKAYRPNDIDLVFDKPTFHIDATRPTGLLAIQRYYDVGIEASILSSESLKTWDVHELRAGKAKSGRCYYQRQAESNVMDMRYQEELNEYRKVKVEKICVNPWLSSDLARFVGRTREGRSLEALPTNSDWPFEIRPEAELETMQKSDHEQRSVVDQIEQAIEDLERKYWTYCQSVLCNPSKEKESGKQPSIANENESRQGQPSGNTSSPSGTGLEQSSLKVPKPTIIPLKGRNLRQGLGPKINRAAVRTSRTVTKANSMEPSSHGSDVLQDETSPGELPLSTTPPGDPPRPFKFQ